MESQSGHTSSELGGGDYIGIWFEDEDEYWFRFSLDNRKPPPRQKRSDDSAPDHAPLTRRDIEEREREARALQIGSRQSLKGDRDFRRGDHALRQYATEQRKSCVATAALEARRPLTGRPSAQDVSVMIECFHRSTLNSSSIASVSLLQ
jgi:hypothetical protein